MKAKDRISQVLALGARRAEGLAGVGESGKTEVKARK